MKITKAYSPTKFKARVVPSDHDWDATLPVTVSVCVLVCTMHSPGPW